MDIDNKIIKFNIIIYSDLKFGNLKSIYNYYNTIT